MCRVVNHLTLFSLKKVDLGSNDSGSRESTKSSIIKLSEKAFYLIFVGALFDVIAGFLPWGIDARVYYYLPWTPPLLTLDRSAIFLEGSTYVVASLSIRVAAILAWVGVILYEFVKKKLLIPRVFILVSIILSLLAFSVFVGMNFIFSWGFYIAVLGLVCKSVGILSDVLKVEVILEERQE